MAPGGLPPDEYFCNYVLKAPSRSFISFSVGAPFSHGAQKRVWHTNVDNIGGRSVGIGWTSSNLNHPWFAAAAGFRIVTRANTGAPASSKACAGCGSSSIGIRRCDRMMKSFRAPLWRSLKRMILAAGLVGALHAAAVTQAEASASCTAVNSGSFNLTTPASDPGNTSILTAWTVGDRITATFTDAVGFSHADGFFHGPTLGGIGALEQGTVSSGGNVQLMHTVVAGDLTNGILFDPENNNSVTATCITALILTSTPSSTLHVNQSYSQSNVASGGTANYTYSVTVGAVPAGTSLNTSTGLVTGTPTAAGAFSYTITATDSSPAPALTGSQTISGSIIPANSSATSLISSANPSLLGASVTSTATVTGPRRNADRKRHFL